MKRALLIFAAAATPLLGNSPLRFEPAHPSSRDAVKVFALTACPAGTRGVVKRSGSAIEVDFPSVYEGCIATPLLYPAPVELGVLEPGSYEVTAKLMGSITGRARLEVRGVGAHIVYPPASPVGGGGRIFIGESYEFFGPYEVRQVRFGSVGARILQGYDRLVVEAPPHPPAIVDVTIVTRSGNVVIPHSFKYFEGERPDPFGYEPLLVPVFYSGPGAAGSHWRTEVWLGTVTSFSRPIVFHPPPCAACPGEVRGVLKVEGPSRPDGLVLHLARGGRPDLVSSIRAQDMSRTHSNAGTELPLVGTEQFRERVRLINVPRGVENRYSLRVWSRSEGQRSSTARLAISAQSSAPVTYLELKLSEGLNRGFSFGVVDLSAQIRSTPQGDPLTVSVSAEGAEVLWAMLTITNEATGQVTILTPQILAH